MQYAGEREIKNEVVRDTGVRGREEGERERDDGQNFNHFLLEKKLFLTYKKDKRVNIKETKKRNK